MHVSTRMKSLPTEAESRLLVSWVGGLWEAGLCANEQKGPFWKERNIFKCNCFDDCTILQIY